MTETTQSDRERLLDMPVDNIVHSLCRDADRLAQYERDLHDDIGKDRSQDTDWLRAGFLQRGAEIERLEDGIRALARPNRSSKNCAACWTGMNPAQTSLDGASPL